MAKKAQILAYICIAIGFLILLHQYIFYEVWFEPSDIHHETFSIALFTFAIGILLGIANKNEKVDQ